MIAQIKTIDDFELSGKTVLLRVDINSPVDESGNIKDDTRIRKSAPTIRELSEKNAKTVVLAHQADPLDYQNFTTLKEHGEMLSELVGKPVRYIEDVAGPTALEAIKNLKEGEILLLENIRIYTEETVIFEKQVQLTAEQQAKTRMVKKLAPLADVYLCDAFACVHRSEPSLVGFPEVLPSGAGRLFEEEVRVLTKVTQDPKRPCVFVLGGAKILDAFNMMESALENGTADKVLTTGLVGQVMLQAAGVSLGTGNEEFIVNKKLDQFVDTGKKILEAYSDKVVYPQDVGVDMNGKREEINIYSLPTDGLIKDIGAETVKQYAEIISQAGTVFANGPAGVYEQENFSFGTGKIWQSIEEIP